MHETVYVGANAAPEIIWRLVGLDAATSIFLMCGLAIALVAILSIPKQEKKPWKKWPPRPER